MRDGDHSSILANDQLPLGIWALDCDPLLFTAGGMCGGGKSIYLVGIKEVAALFR